MLLRSFESFEKTENGYLIHGDAADVKLIFMTDDIIRVRVHFDKGTPHGGGVLHPGDHRMA